MPDVTHQKPAPVLPFFRFCRFFCRWASVLYFRLRAFGTHNVPECGGGILVANHQSYMDPVIVTVPLARECDFMARDTLFRNKAFAKLITSLNAFPVRRGEADIGAIKESLRRLKRGRLIVMFPEGTRTEDGRIGTILPGLDALARKTNVPIIPVLIDGLFQVWPRTNPLPRPGNVIIEYDKSITPAEYAHMDAQELTALIGRRLQAMQRRWHSRMPERRLEWFDPSGQTADIDDTH